MCGKLSFAQFILIIALLSCITACKNNTKVIGDKTILDQSWTEIEESSKGTKVHFMMWQGSPAVNKYINNYLKPTMKEKYNIDLIIVGGQGPGIVQLIMGEKQAGAKEGQVDMVWINGETFFQLREIEGLYGPFVQKLPNAKFIDFDNKFINTDFQQTVDNMECPWSVTQFAMVCDSTVIPNPPKNMESLTKYVKNSPGTFTISNDFSGMTLLKSFLAELSGRPDGLNGPFDEELYNKLSDKLWKYINENKKYFWREGTTFPKEQSKMDQMYASGEIKLLYGFSEGGVEDKVSQGLYPKTTIAYPWTNGTIRNTNYLGISYNTSNLPGALVTINHMISPEAQLVKADPKGMDANTVLDLEKLPLEWKEKFEKQTVREYGVSLKELDASAIQEPDPRYMLRLFDDFRTYVIEQ